MFTMGAEINANSITYHIIHMWYVVRTLYIGTISFMKITKDYLALARHPNHRDTWKTAYFVILF